jgi:hypothetical protein
MYGANPPAAGGLIGGTLAATGSDLTWPIIIIAISITIGVLLMIRERYLRNSQTAAE